MNDRQTVLAVAATVLVLFFGCGKPEVQEQVQAPVEVQEEAVKEYQSLPGPESVPEIQRKASIKRPGRMKKQRDPAAAPLPAEIEARRQKRVFEFVQIAGHHYEVPRPWRGNKITDPQPPASAMEQVPLEFAWNESRIYVHRHAHRAFVRMAEKAKEEGVRLLAHSGFRSSAYQEKIFTTLMAKGRTWEDLVRYVAPPGYSNHMLGFSIDLYPSNWRFASTEAYRWLSRYAGDFGFYETYPEFSRGGYPWEAWHWQFIPEAEKGDSSSHEQAAIGARLDPEKAKSRKEAF